MTYTHESYLGWRGRNYGAEKVQFKNRIATVNITQPSLSSKCTSCVQRGVQDKNIDTIIIPKQEQQPN